jgi:hypothetical protein
MPSREMERLPQLPGVTFRLGRGEQDAPAYVTLLHACQSVDGIDAFSTLEGLPTVEEVAAFFVGLDLQQMLVAEADSRMIGYVHTTWWEEGEGPLEQTPPVQRPRRPNCFSTRAILSMTRSRRWNTPPSLTCSGCHYWRVLRYEQLSLNTTVPFGRREDATGLV